MGWVSLFAVLALAAALLAVLRLPRALWSAAGAVLLLGATGYALQGRPGLPGAKPKPQVDTIEVAPEFVALREAMWGRFTAEWQLETTADALLRQGNARGAVQVLLAGVRRYPTDPELWTALGSALVAHDGGIVSPPALNAFNRAMALAPRHPAPRFFLGLGYVQMGELSKARAAWAESLALTPPSASYRRDIAERIAVLDALAQMQAGQAPPGGQ